MDQEIIHEVLDNTALIGNDLKADTNQRNNFWR